MARLSLAEKEVLVDVSCHSKLAGLAKTIRFCVKQRVESVQNYANESKVCECIITIMCHLSLQLTRENVSGKAGVLLWFEAKQRRKNIEAKNQSETEERDGGKVLSFLFEAKKG